MPTPGVYQSSYGKYFIEQTEKAISIRIKEHEKDERTENLAVAEHDERMNHKIDFNKVKILNKGEYLWKKYDKRSYQN